MLERVFPPSSQWYDRIWYDVSVGQYYDKYTDIYLEYAELAAFGLGV
jgi:hypothetical protein